MVTCLPDLCLQTAAERRESRKNGLKNRSFQPTLWLSLAVEVD